MGIQTQLNTYLDQLACSGKDLADASGLSPSVISRYRSGSRVPAIDSGILEKLAEGIARLSEKSEKPLTAQTVLEALKAGYPGQISSAQVLANRLDSLIALLSINVSDLSRTLNFDPSYISMIRRGKRTPKDVPAFAREIGRFVSLHHQDTVSRTVLARVLSQEAYPDQPPEIQARSIADWLCQAPEQSGTDASGFLHSIDDFDLDAYLDAVNFDAIKIPSVPFQLPTAKTYEGLAAMSQGELDFLKTVVLGKAMDELIMGSDMPMEDLTAVNPELVKQYAFGIGMILKKGLHIHFVHTVDRPMEEMLVGLKSWIPLYMTGQISPYYQTGGLQKIFGHLLYSAGGCAMAGECVRGHHDEGRYFLTKRRKDVVYYRKRAKRFLEKARPLMTIYRTERAGAFSAFLAADASLPGKRGALLTAPPLYTLPKTLLFELLESQGMDAQTIQTILDSAESQRHRIEAILKDNSITVTLPALPPDVFAARPVHLILADTFRETEVFYTEAIYQAHLKATRVFADTHPGFSCTFVPKEIFNNIQIRIHHGKWAMVSKGRSPVIHFVINHPNMIQAMEALLTQH